MFHHLDFPRLFLCESTGYSKHKTTGIASVAICGGSNHILTGLLVSWSCSSFASFYHDKICINVFFKLWYHKINCLNQYLKLTGSNQNLLVNLCKGRRQTVNV